MQGWIRENISSNSFQIKSEKNTDFSSNVNFYIKKFKSRPFPYNTHRSECTHVTTVFSKWLISSHNLPELKSSLSFSCWEANVSLILWSDLIVMLVEVQLILLRDQQGGTEIKRKQALQWYRSLTHTDCIKL